MERDPKKQTGLTDQELVAKYGHLKTDFVKQIKKVLKVGKKTN